MLLEFCIVFEGIFLEKSVSISIYGKKILKTVTNIINENRAPRWHVLNIPFRDKKPTIGLFGDDGTDCFVKKTTRH